MMLDYKLIRRNQKIQNFLKSELKEGESIRRTVYDDIYDIIKEYILDSTKYVVCRDGSYNIYNDKTVAFKIIVVDDTIKSIYINDTFYDLLRQTISDITKKDAHRDVVAKFLRQIFKEHIKDGKMIRLIYGLSDIHIDTMMRKTFTKRKYVYNFSEFKYKKIQEQYSIERFFKQILERGNFYVFRLSQYRS